eukprot:1175904-Pyramimonas_sp.AAC.1
MPHRKQACTRLQNRAIFFAKGQGPVIVVAFITPESFLSKLPPVMYAILFTKSFVYPGPQDVHDLHVQ